MNSSLESVYLRFAMAECEMALKAWAAVNAAANMTSDDDAIRCAITFVQHCAAISRMFWSPDAKPPEIQLAEKDKKKRKIMKAAYDRCLHLRSVLSLQNGDHAIRKRSLRDNFEHFDQRLDEWAATSGGMVIVTSVVGGPDAVGGDLIKHHHIIHRLDPTTWEYFFRGEAFSLLALQDGVLDIESRVTKRLKELDSTPAPRGTVHIGVRIVQLPDDTTAEPPRNSRN